MKQMFLISTMVFLAILSASGQKFDHPRSNTESPKMEPSIRLKRQITATEKEVMQMERKFASAIMRNDMEALSHILADDYTFTDDSGATKTKVEVLGELVQRLAPANVTSVSKHRHVDLEDVDIGVSGNEAEVSGQTAVMIKSYDTEHDINDQYEFNRLWEKRQGRWQLVTNRLTAITQ